MIGFHKELVQDLRDAVWDKKEEIRALQEQNRELRKIQQEQDQIGGVHAQLHKQDAEIEDLKRRRADGGNNLLIVWILSVAFACYFGMVMSSS